MKIPAKLDPADVAGIIDTREQHPLDLQPLQTMRGTLATGDYSLRGLTHCVAIERKSLPDLLGCVGRERERFEREIMRLQAYPVRALVVESTWQAIERGEWSSKVTAAAAMGSLIGWIAAGIPVVMAGDHERAGKFVAKLLYTTARRRWQELRTMAAGIGTEQDG